MACRRRGEDERDNRRYVKEREEGSEATCARKPEGRGREEEKKHEGSKNVPDSQNRSFLKKGRRKENKTGKDKRRRRELNSGKERANPRPGSVEGAAHAKKEKGN